MGPYRSKSLHSGESNLSNHLERQDLIPEEGAPDGEDGEPAHRSSPPHKKGPASKPLVAGPGLTRRAYSEGTNDDNWGRHALGHDTQPQYVDGRQGDESTEPVRALASGFPSPLSPRQLLTDRRRGRAGELGHGRRR